MTHNESLPVVAAIPNYNMGVELGTLLPQVLEQDYAQIYVLDDASTDDSRELVSEFGRDVVFVAGETNKGAAANRNRVLEVLETRAIIHFIDADMELESERAVEVIQDIMAGTKLGFAAGLAKTPRGSQNVFNYGPRQCLRTDIFALLHLYVSEMANENPAKAAALRQRFEAALRDWPNVTQEPQARRIFWAIEQNLLIDSHVFEVLGGFDPSLREHEIQDMAIRLHAMGLERRFDPALSATHREGDVRGGHRRLKMLRAELQIARKHGLKNWLMPDGKFKPEL